MVHAVPRSHSARLLLLLMVAVGVAQTSLAHARVEQSHAPRQRVTIMPFGDSLTTCCHSCEVAAEALPQDLRRSAAVEPRMAYEGYMRPLWQSLVAAEHSSSAQHFFDFVGRNTDCIFARKNNGTRATTDDWPVRFEGHYGHTTKMILKKRVALAAVEDAINVTGRPPDVTLLHLGTNDLLLGKGRYVGGKLESLVRQFAFGHSGGGDADSGLSDAACAQWQRASADVPSSVPERRAVVLALPMPVDFGHVLMGAGAGDGMRTRRKRVLLQRGLHGAIADAVVRLTNASRRHIPLPRWRQDDPVVDAAVGAVVAETWPVLGQWSIHGVPCGNQRRQHGPAAQRQQQHATVELVLVDLFSPGVSTVSAGAKRDFLGDPSAVAKALLHGDGVHPNAAGERRMAERFHAAVRHLVARPPEAAAARPPIAAATAAASPSARSSALSDTREAAAPTTTTTTAASAAAADDDDHQRPRTPPAIGNSGVDVPLRSSDTSSVGEGYSTTAATTLQPAVVVAAVSAALVAWFRLRRRCSRLC